MTGSRLLTKVLLITLILLLIFFSTQAFFVPAEVEMASATEERTMVGKQEADAPETWMELGIAEIRRDTQPIFIVDGKLNSKI